MNGRFDRDGARRRVAALEATLAPSALTDARQEKIFAQRAERLAVPLAAETPADRFEALVFRLGTERYAFPSSSVREVRPAGEITPLPGTPEFIAGLVNVRGHIVSVLDLGRLFGLPNSDVAPRTILLLAGAQGDVGVLASELPAIRWLASGELGELPAGLPAGLNPACVRGVTADVVVVLDADRLLADANLAVREER